MKTTIRAQLFRRLLILLFLMALIAVSGIVVTSILKKTSNQIVFEYIELNAVQELRLSFNKTYIPAFNYLLYQDPNELELFRERIVTTYNHIQSCKEILNESHSKDLLVDFEEYLSYYEHVVYRTEVSEIDIMKNRNFIPLLEGVVDSASQKVELILHETKEEINEYIGINSKAVKHSTVTIISLSIVIIVLGFVIGSLFVRQIVRPITQLRNYTKEVENGNWNVRSSLKTNNELGSLSDAFNSMISHLQLTTVSRELFNNILSSMHELIVVTDVDGHVVMANIAANKMLGYEKQELEGISVLSLFKEDFRSKIDDVFSLTKLKMTDTEYCTNSGKCLPVLMSCSMLYDKQGNPSGVVLVAADMREKVAAEKELAQERRKTLIEINEAQEKERIRLAKELHDGLGQMLTGILYYIENNLRYECSEHPVFSFHIKKIQGQIDASIMETKSIAADLIPMQLKDFGLEAAVQNLVDMLNVQQKAKFEFFTFNMDSRLDEKLEKNLYRIIQEAANNIIKHSKAQNAGIQLIRHENSVSLIIHDDGVGFNYSSVMNETKNRGIGLCSIKERVASYDGFLNVTSGTGNGTELLIEISTD